MSKLPQNKNSAYLQFRPYRAFTAAPERAPRADAGTMAWRVIVVVGAVVGLLLAALQLGRH